MFAVRCVVTFFLSTIAFVFLLLANLSGAKAPFVRNLYFSKIEDQYGQYIWTMYNFCSFSGKELTGTGTCSATKAAYPYEPYKWGSGFSRYNVYKNGSKAAYALILVALLLTILANVANLAAFFKRSSKFFSVYKYTTLGALSLIFIGAVINTGLHKNGTKRIVKDGVYTAHMGKTMIAFIWLPVILQLASVLVSFLWRVKQSPRDVLDDKEHYDENPFESSERRAL
ncbi:SUR7/PalI family protein [Metschnikowia aff. pulcherrima]|uniref:SUR7/PalI family protein n=1 Tax=Metschnikowia aff. pulcherrima TaxID=2163413 RepID=A0A4P6XRM0_9ASCO|nr:SUR7/PalI family protein [Metschnikowia aff. pulcherrima]